MPDQDTIERSPETATPKEDRPGAISTAFLGATAGAIGGFALDRADWLMWNTLSEETREKTRRVRPNGEPPAHVAASKIEKALDLDPGPQRHATRGQAIHFGIGMLPAIGYALVRDKLPGKGVARGLMFGGGMFLMQDEVANSVSGLGAKPSKYPWQAHARGLIAHLIFGVVTELTLNAMQKSARRLAEHDGRESRMPQPA